MAEVDDIYSTANTRMQKTISAFEDDLKKIRSGRASTGLVDHIQVDYYGSQLSLNQVANVTTEDSRTILITPWEKTMLSVMEKAILASGIGLNPIASSDNLRLPVPSMTEETRRDIVKLVKSSAENSRISIRNTRRDVNNDVRQKCKSKELTEDDQKAVEDRVQTLTDSFIKKIDTMTIKKEDEILAI